MEKLKKRNINEANTVILYVVHHAIIFEQNVLFSFAAEYNTDPSTASWVYLLDLHSWLQYKVTVLYEVVCLHFNYASTLGLDRLERLAVLKPDICFGSY